jgi:hypothetical protein
MRSFLPDRPTTRIASDGSVGHGKKKTLVLALACMHSATVQYLRTSPVKLKQDVISYMVYAHMFIYILYI